MKKIFNRKTQNTNYFKRIVIFIVLGLFLITLSSCFKNQVNPNEGSIRLYLDEEFISYMEYLEVPDFVLTFEGVFNTIANTPDTNACIFASNDDVRLSPIIAKLIENYSVYVDVIKIDKAKTARINTLDENGKTVVNNFLIDNELSYDEVAYLSLPNGLKMTINYRRFISQGITYYCWRYTSSITLYLYFPLMVIREDSKKKLLLLTLPDRIGFQVGSQLKVTNIITKDEYLSDAKYTFEYLDDIEDKITYVKNYYLINHQGYEENNHFYFQYLNIKYEIIFLENAFTIHYVGSVS